MKVKVLSALCAVALMFSLSTFAQEKTLEDYAQQIQLDFSEIKDTFFGADAIQGQLAPQLFAIKDARMRIQVYDVVKAGYEKIKNAMLTDLERSLAYAYINSPALKDKSQPEQSKAIYEMQKEGLLDWTAMGDVYYALIFTHLLNSDAYQTKEPIEKLKHLDTLREDACPWMILSEFKKKIFWNLFYGKSDEEISQIKQALKEADIKDTFSLLPEKYRP